MRYLKKEYTSLDGIAMYSSSASNVDLINYECYRNYSTYMSSTLTDSVKFPNILATDKLHPVTGTPLYRKMSLPSFSYASKEEMRSAISVVDINGNIVSDREYYIEGSAEEITIYTNLKGPFIVNYSPYPYLRNSRESRLMLSLVPSLIYNEDYTVSYDGNYKLSSEYYVTTDEDKKSVLQSIYKSDIYSPWFVHLTNMNIGGINVQNDYNEYNVTLTAKRIANNIYTINARDIIDVDSNEAQVISFSRNGYALINSNMDNIKVTVRIGTNMPVVKRNDIPCDFRPNVMYPDIYNVKYYTDASITSTYGRNVGNIELSAPGESTYTIKPTGFNGNTTTEKVATWGNSRIIAENGIYGIVLTASSEADYNRLCNLAANENSFLASSKVAGRPMIIRYGSQYSVY